MEIEELKAMFTYVEERVDLRLKYHHSTAADLLAEFGDQLTKNEFREALWNGSMGYYGRTHRLSTQELFIWVQQYVNDKQVTINNQN
jgi:hypothetical protein